MADQPGIIPDLAALLMAALWGRRDATAYADRIAARLGLGEGVTEAGAEAGLRRALGLASGLRERVTAVLAAAGFTDSRDVVPGAFLVTGAGATATVSVPWWTGETDAARMLLLAGFARALKKDGFKVTDHGRYLSVRARAGGDRP
jgi:hypothetical protein